MKLIPLTQNKFTWVDDEDFELVSQFNWWFNRGYARARVNGKRMYMHVLIMQPKEGEEVDHINHNKLDNRRINLRCCSHAVNIRNLKPKTSKYSGVHYDKSRGKWRAEVNRKFLGRFKTEIEAANAVRNYEPVKPEKVSSKG